MDQQPNQFQPPQEPINQEPEFKQSLIQPSQPNKKLWMYVLVGLIIVGGVLGFWWWQQSNTKTTNWQTYRNDGYGFEVKYPNDFDFVEGEADFLGRYYIGIGPHFFGAGQPLATVAFPEGAYNSETDFEGGYFSVNHNTSGTIEDCQKSEGGTMTDTQELNGVIFTKTEIGGVAGGHSSRDIIYHTFRDEGCYELVLGLRYENVTNKPHVNEDEVIQTLDQILSTFRFIE